MTMRTETVVCGNQQLDVPRGTGHVFFRLVNEGKKPEEAAVILRKKEEQKMKLGAP